LIQKWFDKKQKKRDAPQKRKRIQEARITREKKKKGDEITPRRKPPSARKKRWDGVEKKDSKGQSLKCGKAHLEPRGAWKGAWVDINVGKRT